MQAVTKPIVLFDGICNFCNRTINFILKQDKGATLLFAPMQSAVGQKLLQQYGLKHIAVDSFVLIADGKAYTKSTAGLKLYSYLPHWRWTKIFWLVPRPIRDFVYDMIAKNRYRLFGKRDVCMMPTAAQRSRFLA